MATITIVEWSDGFETRHPGTLTQADARRLYPGEWPKPVRVSTYDRPEKEEIK